MPFRKLEQLDCNSNKISKTEIDEFDFETEDHYWWENFQDEGSFSDAFLIGQILAPFPPLVQHNILQLYNVWNSQWLAQGNDDGHFYNMFSISKL